MSSTNDFPIEQSTKPKKKEPKTDAELRTEYLDNKYSIQTDRQLLVEQVEMDKARNIYLNSIKNNVQFFFWLTIIGISIWLIILWFEAASSNY